MDWWSYVIRPTVQPLHWRVQAWMDRRFYECTHHAQQTFLAVSIRLRDETDLGQWTADVVHVVPETVQPAHRGVWLREPEVQ